MSENARVNRPRLSVVISGIIILAFVSAFLVTGWVRSQQGHDVGSLPSRIETLANPANPADPLAKTRSRGRKVYNHYCAICHGVEGKGDGFNSATLKIKPRDFSNAEFWKETTAERVRFVVTKGGRTIGKSVLMPAWGKTLTSEQVGDVIVFIHAFAEK